jgi:uncharacterized protein (UPF0333 family)
MRRDRKAQSTLEYVVVFTAVVAAVLAIVYSTVGSPTSDAGMGKLLNTAAGKIANAAGNIANILP